jgi:shikimate dehydrogenase
MLVAQAEMASRLFLARQAYEPARPELVNRILNLILKETQNIALIGMPGSGKSTVGRILAQAMGRPFADIDGQIEAAAGKSIPQVFADDGEETFRRLETRILAEEAKKSGMVLATGGGVVTRPENLDLLRQNSLIVYLKRELTELITDGRPLSQNIGIQALAEKRLPLYDTWNDYAVQVEAEPEQTAARIQQAIG